MADLSGSGPHDVETTFRQIVAGLPDEEGLFGSGALNDTICAVLRDRSSPLPELLLPRWAVVPAVIDALLHLDYCDPPERNLLLKGVRRHQAMFGGIVRVDDYPDTPLASDLGVDVLPCATALAVVWLDVGPYTGWLAAQLAPIFAPPRWYARPATRGPPPPARRPSSSAATATPSTAARCRCCRAERCTAPARRPG